MKTFICAIVLVLFSMPSIASAKPAKLSAEQVIDHTFRSDTPLPGSTPENHENLLKIRALVVSWLGNYQGVRAENGRSVIQFEQGSIPVTVNFRPNGEPDTVSGSECPTTSLRMSQAPREIQEAFPICGDLKR
jgi:hypothetical protein